MLLRWRGIGFIEVDAAQRAGFATCLAAVAKAIDPHDVVDAIAGVADPAKTKEPPRDGDNFAALSENLVRDALAIVVTLGYSYEDEVGDEDEDGEEAGPHPE